MALDAGTRLGQYEILEPIGAGGMGEVYRARDTTLGRDVAVKVLPDTLSHPERLARFEREAKLLAALNHPGIATLHGLERSDEQPVLVMELVDGDTLAERIARGPIPLEEAVEIFTQIADALGAAHAKGIVHRDLKPANIKIMPDGKIKILDFGLAKLSGTEPEASGGAASLSPTLTKNTALGVILGTASYMSPEQARGKVVDKRTDIWAFGCCLYEALTGRKAFDGDTVPDVLSNVLQRDPDWSALPAQSPARLIRRCLEKNAARRVHDIADARLDLEEDSSAAPFTETRPSWRATVPLLALAALAGALVSWLVRAPSPPPSAVKRFSINLPPGDEFISGGPEGPLVAISPDGSKVVYAGVHEGRAQLFLRRIDEQTAKPLSGTENGRMPFFSPDGQWVGFTIDRRRIKRVAVDGGPPATVTDLASAFYGGSWVSDRGIVYGRLGGSLSWVSPAGGTPRDAPQLEEGFWPQVLPDGTGAVYVSDAQALAAVSFDTGEAHELGEVGTYPRFAPSGHLVYAREGALFAAPFDPERLEITGAAVPVLDGVGQGGAGEAYYDISEDGTLVYIAGQTKPETGLVWVDRAGESRPLGPTRPATWETPRLSPDGRLVVVALEPQDAPPDLWLIDTTRESLTRFTSEPPSFSPVWASESRSVVYERDGMAVRQSVETTGPPTFLAECLDPRSMSADGRLLICDVQGEAESWDIVLVRLDDSAATEPLLSSRFDEHSGRLSPDDRWLAYVSNESGRTEVYVQPFPGPGRKVRVSTDGGSEPIWSRNGRELFYRRGQELYALGFTSEGEPGPPALLFSGDFHVGGRNTNYDVALDGEHFVMIRSEPSEVRPEIHVVLNWTEELKRLVPTR